VRQFINIDIKITIKKALEMNPELLNEYNKYNKLTDYLNSLGAIDDASICNYAAGLSRANGWSLSKLFNMCEG